MLLFLSGRSNMPNRKTDIGRLKEGRGTGRRGDYKPWHNPYDVSNSGTANRLPGVLFNRVHKTLSGIEHRFLLMLEMNENVIDIQEQRPLSLEKTEQIAKDFGYKHPAVRGVNIVMSTDFLVTVKTPEGFGYIARAIKPLEELSKQRIKEKLAIEREYWEQKNIDWKVITEEDISKTLTYNIDLFRAKLFWYDREKSNITNLMTSYLLKWWEEQSDTEPINIMKFCNDQDKHFGLVQGFTLNYFKVLSYLRIVNMDLETKRFNPKLVYKECK